MTKILIKQIPDVLSDKNCYISLYPELPYQPVGDLMVVVTPLGGTFPEKFQAGGGKNQCTEESSVFVTIFSRCRSDRAGRDIDSLADRARGVLRLQQRILAALVMADPQVPTPGQSGTDSVLRDLMMARQSSNPEHATPDKDWVQYATEFSTSFDWQLSTIPTIV